MRPKIIRLKPLFLLTAPFLRLKSEAIDIAKLSVLLLSFSTAAVWAQTQDYTRWVNPFIGTGGHGHTFPGAVVPFGMVQLSPDTRGADWDGSSGYHYSDDVIYGFSHTHLSGTGIPDGCDILFMPTVGEPQFFAKNGDKAVNGYASKFSHTNEHAEPGYYSVKLDDDNILAELTTTKRVGFQRYTFPSTDSALITLDLTWRDKLIDSKITFVGDRRIEGFRRSSSWAKDQIVYFVAEFSKQPKWAFRTLQPDSKVHEDITNKKMVFGFETTNIDPILLKVAISSVSIEGARKNLAAELPGWDFDKVRADARAAWNKELSKIEVSGGTDAQTTTFYTALYHTMIHPSLFNDVDGNYRGLDGKTHNICESISGNSKLKTGSCIDHRNSVQSSVSSHQSSRSQPSPQYTVFSLWDTFRAAHPLYTIIEQKRTVDFINTFIRMYEQGGRLPVWELWGNETDTMIGYHAVSVIADAMAKGIKGFDYEKAYEAAKHSAELDRDGLAAYKKRGYISSEDENESVSKTLEYAYDDWCIAKMAEILIRMKGPANSGGSDQPTQAQIDEELRKAVDGYNVAWPRSFSFENIFDPSTGFMRPRKNGGFISPFAPNEVTFNYTEGNAWVYTFFVPHDISRLIELEGGREKFAAKLDELFTTTDKLTGRGQPDITGLIGQYAHGNEPSHHIAYLYDYVGQPWKTQKYVRQIMDEFYKNAPDGLIGNEDCGQMSAWYVLSATGFYSVTPGDPAFAIGTPLFPSATYHLENGNKFVIRASNVSDKNIYIKSVRFNGSLFSDRYLLYQNIMRGGVMEFEMTDDPTDRTTDLLTMQIVGNTSTRYAAVPIVESEGKIFKDKESVAFKTITPDSKIFYTLDGRNPTYGGQLYTKPIAIRTNTTIKAITKLDAIGGETPSFPNIPWSPVVEATFLKRPNNWTVKIDSKYSRQYNGGGDEGLVDGIRGSTNFASGEWQGYQGQDFVATVDLQKETEIHSVGAGFLQVARSWIWMPTRVQFEVSNDGVDFRPVADIKTDVAIENMDPVKRDYRQAITTTKARYIRVHAYNLGKIPSWHPGAGGDAYIFVDEILID